MSTRFRRGPSRAAREAGATIALPGSAADRWIDVRSRVARGSRKRREDQTASTEGRRKQRIGLRRLLGLAVFLPLASRAPLYGRLFWELVRDDRTPVGRKALLAGALGYLVLGRDLIPDDLPVIGGLDDLVVVVLRWTCSSTASPSRPAVRCRAIRRAGATIALPGSAADRGIDVRSRVARGSRKPREDQTAPIEGRRKQRIGLRRLLGVAVFLPLASRAPLYATPVLGADPRRPDAGRAEGAPGRCPGVPRARTGPDPRRPPGHRRPGRPRGRGPGRGRVPRRRPRRTSWTRSWTSWASTRGRSATTSRESGASRRAC